ncbi:hypothetical protein OS493_004082 [Desmophyllum pertusum]|uniref:Uncharacterized protein n=1 Tax=Desmophyllum pertusum TaxID=174260 RepID=A0A9X0D4K9_9CNID|nr:hypothetical protein OS493_004082 [Desmophyllum pertusum]
MADQTEQGSNLCGKVVVAWSCRNLIAFSTGYRKLNPGEGNNSTGANEQSKRSQVTNGINILDPDSPWMYAVLVLVMMS